MRKARTMVRIMAMEITQSTRLVSVNIFRILGYIEEEIEASGTIDSGNATLTMGLIRGSSR